MSGITPTTYNVSNVHTSKSKDATKQDIILFDFNYAPSNARKEKKYSKHAKNLLLNMIEVFLKKREEQNKIYDTRTVIASIMKNEKNAVLSNEDLNYWTDLIKNNSDLSNIDPIVLAGIIVRESACEKNILSVNGVGPMQVTTITLQDMFSDTGGGRKRLYELIDKNMLEQILYKTDSEGKLILDSSGKPIRRCNTPGELRIECSKDDDLGIKAGIMCLKMKFAQAVSKKKGISLNEAIKQLASGNIKLTNTEVEAVIETSLRNYNAVFDEYAPAIIDSIKAVSKTPYEDMNIYKKM